MVNTSLFCHAGRVPETVFVEVFEREILSDFMTIPRASARVSVARGRKYVLALVTILASAASSAARHTHHSSAIHASVK